MVIAGRLAGSRSIRSAGRGPTTPRHAMSAEAVLRIEDRRDVPPRATGATRADDYRRCARGDAGTIRRLPALPV